MCQALVACECLSRLYKYYRRPWLYGQLNHNNLFKSDIRIRLGDKAAKILMAHCCITLSERGSNEQNQSEGHVYRLLQCQGWGPLWIGTSGASHFLLINAKKTEEKCQPDEASLWQIGKCITPMYPATPTPSLMINDTAQLHNPHRHTWSPPLKAQKK